MGGGGGGPRIVEHVKRRYGRARREGWKRSTGGIAKIVDRAGEENGRQSLIIALVEGVFCPHPEPHRTHGARRDREHAGSYGRGAGGDVQHISPSRVLIGNQRRSVVPMTEALAATVIPVCAGRRAAARSGATGLTGRAVDPMSTARSTRKRDRELKRRFPT